MAGDNAVGYFEDDPELLKPTGLGPPSKLRSALKLVDQAAARHVQRLSVLMRREQLGSARLLERAASELLASTKTR